MMRVLILSLLLFPLLGSSQESDLENKVVTMMEILGTTERFESVIDNLIELQKADNNEFVDDQFWVLFKEELKKDGFTSLNELLIPIYIKHFSEEEIDAIINFYGSDIGRSVVSKFSIISQESMEAGAVWGEEFGKEIMEKLTSSNEVKFNTVHENCGSFKTGEFTYDLPDGTKGKVVRTDTEQVETSPNGIIKSKIEWISDCRYNLKVIEGLEGLEEDAILEVNIYEVTENGYKYVSRMTDYDLYVLGEHFRKN